MLQLYICCVSYSNVHVVVATTRHLRTNDLTTSKALQWAIKERVGELQENLTRSPCYIAPLYILLHRGLCYNNIYLALKSMPLPYVHYSSSIHLP